MLRCVRVVIQKDKKRKGCEDFTGWVVIRYNQQHQAWYVAEQTPSAFTESFCSFGISDLVDFCSVRFKVGYYFSTSTMKYGVPYIR